MVRLLSAILYFTFVLASSAWAQQFNCRWDGTSPICSGVCPAGEVEVGRAANVSENNFPSTSNFGSACLIGSKARCCKDGSAEAGGQRSGQGCFLSGTAPFCDGECPSGYKQQGRQEANCWTGTKAYCCPDLTPSRPPTTRDCTYGNGTCVQGFVWREARPNDRVCVVRSQRDKAAQDNASATSRRSAAGGAYGPDTCIPGFVWREAFTGDHVCVTSQTRADVAADNAVANLRNSCP